MKLFKFYSNFTSKLIAITTILFFSLSTAFAQPGVLDIVFKQSENGSNGIEILSTSVEQNKIHTIVLVDEKDQKFVKSVRPTNGATKVNFNLPSGIYRVSVVNSDTGYIQRFRASLE